MLKIAMIPIDNRPVCFCLPKDINMFCEETEFFIPPRELLGGLTTSAQINKILDWLENLEQIDILIVALDTVAYGGLVASRRTTDTFETIKSRLERLKNILETKNVKTYACSSIMRISNNNINEEEKEYWNLWGKKIFDYSFNLHKAEKTQSYDSNAKFSCIRQILPTEILEDYFQTRKRNFDINKLYLEWQKSGLFNYLVFSKDDCAQYGINVAEAEELQEIISKSKLNALIKTGADEIPLSLMARAITDTKQVHLKIYPQFLRPNQIDLISKYEDVSIYESVKGQIELCGSILAENEDDADIILLVNNFENEQGELVMGVDTKQFSTQLTLPKKPYIIADVTFANGADNNFVTSLLNKQIDWNNFLGYAAWNTSANTLGSALCAGIFKFLTKHNVKNFKTQQLIRFADDWAYQANCREKLKAVCKSPDSQTIKKLMTPFIDKLKTKLELSSNNINYKFPWNRFFEIEIIVNKY